jgi:phage terminase large subunit
MGQWAAAEGVIYEEWNPAVHLVAPFEIPDDWVRWWAIDFGFTNPFVWQNWAENKDGILFLTQEIYRTQTIVQDHALEICRLTVGQRQPNTIVTDHDPDGQDVAA